MTTPQRIIYLQLLFCSAFLLIFQSVHAEEKLSPGTELDYGIISGEWQRTDGSYLIRVSDVQANGQVRVEYFNPSPIHVAQDAISTENKLIRLFVKFQDRGYEGSTYTLFYYAEKDALVGFYYQAVMDKTFEVIFTRKKN